MFRAGERTPASRRRWRWTAAGLSSRVSCVVASEKRGRPQGEKKKGTVTWAVCEAQRWGRQAARVGRAGWGLGRGSEKSSTGHGPDGAGSKAPWGSLPAQGPSVEGRPPPSLCQAAVRAGVLARTHAMRKAKPAGDGWLTAERPMPLPRTHGGRGPAGGPQAPLVLKKKKSLFRSKSELLGWGPQFLRGVCKKNEIVAGGAQRVASQGLRGTRSSRTALRFLPQPLVT